MRANLFKYIMFSSLLAVYGCSSEENNDPFYSEQHPIELGVGIETPQSRAVTDGQGKTLKAFTSATDIWMVMKSDYVSLGSGNTDLDFKGDQTSKYCVTMGTTGNKVTDKEENEVNFELGNLRYWDDVHARSSRLSVWALAVPNKQSTSLWSSTSGWSTSASASATIKDWMITTTQTATSIESEDLCFSNNKADYSPSGSDERMKFNVNASGNAFDQGKLIFYHALTKITINLVEGAGFNNSSTEDFNIDNGVTLNGFNLSGTFNVAQGEFSSQTGPTATTMACGEKTATGYTLEALVMPGRDLSTTLADAVTFSIDKNKYTVSNETLLKALREKTDNGIGSEWTTMEAGKNYVFTFTIKMTDIKVTATVAEWDEVKAAMHEPKINVNKVYGTEGTADVNFTLYRSTTKASGYDANTHADVTYAGGAYTMSPQLYWPNHETHYFFRGIYPTVGTTNGAPEAKVSGSAITVANAAYSQGTYPSDLMLGYPRNADGSADEACKVHSGTQGICATEGNIRMNFQYVMSQVEVILTTTTGDDKVVLDENTTIQILNGYKSGSITLENGTATYTESDKGTYTFAGGTYTDRLDAIIPQSLTDLKFKITVKDSDGKYDSYEATIADIEVTPEGGTKGKISKWEPGKKYIYSLKITKTGIKITATLKDWETVSSDENHIWM